MLFAMSILGSLLVGWTLLVTYFRLHPHFGARGSQFSVPVILFGPILLSHALLVFGSESRLMWVPVALDALLAIELVVACAIAALRDDPEAHGSNVVTALDALGMDSLPRGHAMILDPTNTPIAAELDLNNQSAVGTTRYKERDRFQVPLVGREQDAVSSLSKLLSTGGS